MGFKQKENDEMKSSSALQGKRKRLYRSARWLLPRRMRFFYEGCIDVPGQLWYADRKLIYNRILAHKPENVFEVGTWLGGGSTYFIASGLAQNGFGKLYTVETDKQIYSQAIENYNCHLKQLIPFVDFNHGISTEVYPPILKEIGRVDFLFIDGSDDQDQALNEFNMFKPYLHKGSILVAHDWEDKKMMSLRPVISSSRDWLVEEVLTMPKSVGFAVCRYVAGE